MNAYLPGTTRVSCVMMRSRCWVVASVALIFARSVNAQSPVDATDPAVPVDDAGTPPPLDDAGTPPPPSDLAPPAPIDPATPAVETSDDTLQSKPEGSPPRCGNRPYLEPSLLVSLGSYSPRPSFLPQLSSNAGAITDRLAFGVVVNQCAAGREAMHVRLGVTVFGAVGLLPPPLEGGRTSKAFGFGAELEFGWPLGPLIRLGGRLGGELPEIADGREGAIVAAGARLRYRDVAWLGLDVYRIFAEGTSCDEFANDECGSPTTGVMAGVGLQGRAGLIGGIVNALVLAGGFLSFAGDSW